MSFEGRVTFRWKCRSHINCNGKLLRKMTAKAAHYAGLSGNWDINIVFLGDAAMARANAEYVGHSGTTDVITFSYIDDEENCFPGEVGVELLVCPDAAEREGAKRRRYSSYSREAALYVVHGLLHASGEDDLSPGPRRRMRRREREVMGKLEKEFDFTALFPVREQSSAGE